MALVSETIVREYFESHGFFVRQQRKFVAPSRLEDDVIDFFVLNPKAIPGGPPPFVLNPEDLATVERAIVLVRGWHTETFSPSVLTGAPAISRFLDPAAFRQAAKSFGGSGSLVRLLVMPALPTGDEAREQSIALLRAKGLDGVIPFRTMLQDLINRVEVNRNYQKSDLLQVIRILKNYDFFREPQLELFKAGRRRNPPAGRAKPIRPRGLA